MTAKPTALKKADPPASKPEPPAPRAKAAPVAPKPPDPNADIAGAIVGEWRGFPQYRCSRCAFDTLERSQFALHFSQMHP